MAPRQRTHHPSIPKHIDQQAIPKWVYWDRTGNGRWYVFELEGGKVKRRTIAGPAAKLSDLHAIREQASATGSLEWLSDQYHDSPKFQKLAKLTQADYEYCRGVLLNLPTTTGAKLGSLEAGRLRNQHIQRIVDRLEQDGHPTKANKVLRYVRLIYRWGMNRGLVAVNPGQGVEAAQERKRQRLPATHAYTAVLSSRRSAARCSRTLRDRHRRTSG